MTAEEELEIRSELALLHARLGECELALVSLARAQQLGADPGALAPALETLRAHPALERASASLHAELAALDRRLAAREQPEAPAPAAPRLATSTLAELLERQGHPDSALETARQVLARDPGDARALAIQQRIRGDEARRHARAARLERWLARLERRFGREVPA